MGGTRSRYGGEVHTKFLWGNLREGVHLEDVGVDGRVISNWLFKKMDVGEWTGLIWLRAGAVGAVVNAVMNLRVP